MCNLKKMIQMNLFIKQKQTHRHRNKFMVTKVEKFGNRQAKTALLYLKEITNKT